MRKKFLNILAAASVIFSLPACSSGGISSSSEISSVLLSSSVSSSSSSSISSSSSSVPSSSSEPEPEKFDISKVDNTQKVVDAKKINEDVGGYLYIPDIKIDTPVLDYTINYEKFWDFYDSYYGRKEEETKKRLSVLNWEKKEIGKFAAGSPYLYSQPVYDSRENLSFNLAVMGYNIGVLDPTIFEEAPEEITDPSSPENNEKRRELLNQVVKDYPDGFEFAQLFHFLDQNFAKSHPYIVFSNEKENFIYEIFAVSYIEAEPKYKYYSSRLSQEDAYHMAEQAVSHSIWLYPDITITDEDKFITLSTTPYGYYEDVYDNEQIRFVVTGRLLPKDSTYNETCKIEKNPSPVEPVLREKKSK